LFLRSSREMVLCTGETDCACISATWSRSVPLLPDFLIGGAARSKDKDEVYCDDDEGTAGDDAAAA
jgi:hypothetical protein